jgi:hypothetical protein
MNVKLIGLARVTQALTRRVDRVDNNLQETVNQIAELIFNESQRNVPVDTGNLKASARLEYARGDGMTAEVTYGGTAAGYALIVHEIHPSKSKYLEEPARAALARFEEMTKKSVRDSLK